jgi:hypothetical protein
MIRNIRDSLSAVKSACGAPNDVVWRTNAQSLDPTGGLKNVAE